MQRKALAVDPQLMGLEILQSDNLTGAKFLLISLPDSSENPPFPGSWLDHIMRR